MHCSTPRATREDIGEPSAAISIVTSCSLWDKTLNSCPFNGRHCIITLSFSGNHDKNAYCFLKGTRTVKKFWSKTTSYKHPEISINLQNSVTWNDCNVDKHLQKKKGEISLKHILTRQCWHQGRVWPWWGCVGCFAVPPSSSHETHVGAYPSNASSPHAA